MLHRHFLKSTCNIRIPPPPIKGPQIIWSQTPGYITIIDSWLLHSCLDDRSVGGVIGPGTGVGKVGTLGLGPRVVWLCGDIDISDFFHREKRDVLATKTCSKGI